MEEQLNHIWEAASEGRDVCYEQAEVFSPYYEIADIKENDKNGITVFYNSLYRYESVFACLMSIEGGKQEWQKLLLDLGTHILVEQELQKGSTKKEIKICDVMKQIEQDVYGVELRLRYCKLQPMQKHKLVTCMVEQIDCGASAALFAKVLISLWQTGAVYKNADTPNLLLIYAGEKKTEEKENIVKLVEDIFLPLGYEMRIFWEAHFGVIGNKESLRFGQIELL